MKRTASIAATATAVALAALHCSPVGAAERADGDGAAVRSWNAITVTTLVTAATPVGEQPLHLASVHRAVYGAVLRTANHHREASVPAAITEAAYAVLSATFPAQQARLDQERAAALAAVPDDQSGATGVAAGDAAAEAVLQERAGDGRNGAVVPVPPAGPGVWSPAVPNTVGASSWLGTVRPF